MTACCPPRAARPSASPAAPLPDVPARALRGQLRDQPVDGPGSAGRPRPRGAAVGDAAPDLPRPRPRGRRSSTPSRACPTWCSPPTAASSSAAALGARFTHPSARPRARPTCAGSPTPGSADAGAVHVNEGEGDFLVVGDLMLAGTGFRTDPGAHVEVQELFGELVSAGAGRPALLPPRHRPGGPRRQQRRLLPGRVQRGEPAVLRALFPDAVSSAPSRRRGPRAERRLRRSATSCCRPGDRAERRSCATRGYKPIGIDLSELLKAGGSVKCCTMELRD